MKTKTISISQKQGVQGKIRCQVVDGKTGRVKRDFGWQKNLILNQGMDRVAVNRWQDCWQYCVAGTGTTDTQIDSGVTTASQTGTTVTLSGGSFTFTNTTTDAGRYIKWDTSEEARIVTVTSPTQAEVHVSQSVSAAEFTFLLANQTGMAAESKRTSTCLSGAGNTEVDRTNIATGVWVVRRTFDFSAEAGSVTYNEVGFSWSNAVAANLFSRIKLVSPVALASGDVLRVVYELSFLLTPFAPTATNVTFTGAWGVQAGTLMKGNEGLAVVSTGGLTSGGITREQDEPAVALYIMLATGNPAQPATIQNGAYNFSASIGSTLFVKTPTLVGYVSLTFTRVKTVTFIPSEANATITDIMVGYNNSNSITAGTWFKFTTPQVKDNVHTLVINFTYIWGRVF